MKLQQQHEPASLSAYDQYQRKQYFPILDGLRALSILLVTLEHARGREQWLLMRGLNGVTVFFVISGYLITTLCLREETKSGKVNLKAFYTRRAFRIFPLYYVALAIYVLLIVVENADPPRQQKFIAALPYFATYFQEFPHYLSPGLPFEFAWSLGIEEKFYLIWPVLAFIALRQRKALRIPVAMLLLVACAIPVLFSSYGKFVISYSHILAGCVAALLMHNRHTFNKLQVLGRRRIVWLTCGLAVAIHFLTSLPVIQLEVLFSISISVALVSLLQSRRTAIHSVLESQPLVRLGQISYAIYLFHLLCLNFVAKLIPARHGVPGDLLVWAIGVTLAILVALIMHKIVESPMIAVGRKLSRRQKSAAAPRESLAA